MRPARLPLFGNASGQNFCSAADFSAQAAKRIKKDCRGEALGDVLTNLCRILFGAALVTPLGPLGLDLGYGFDRVDALGRRAPKWQVHFKFGQFF